MKKVLIFILFLFSCSFAINSFTYPWIINLTGDTATVVKWKGNNDTVKAFCDRAADTISFHSRQIDSVQSLYTPWSLFSNHDSTFKWMKIDTVQMLVLNDSISAAEVGKLNGVTENIQSSLNLKMIKSAFSDSLNNNIGSDNVIQRPSGKKLIDGIIYDNGSSIGVGKTSLETWSGTYVAAQVGGNNAMMSTAAEGAGGAFFFLNNLYYDGTWKRISTDEIARIQLQDGRIRFYANGPGPADSAFIPTVRVIIDSNGVATLGSVLSYDGSATEGAYFDANNNLVATESVNSPIIGDTVVNYAATSTIVGWSSFTTKTIRYQKCGKVITVWFNLRGTSNATGATFTLPHAPATGMYFNNHYTSVNNGGVPSNGEVVMDASFGAVVYLFPGLLEATWNASGTKYAYGQFTYFID